MPKKIANSATGGAMAQTRITRGRVAAFKAATAASAATTATSTSTATATTMTPTTTKKRKTASAAPPTTTTTATTAAAVPNSRLLRNSRSLAPASAKPAAPPPTSLPTSPPKTENVPGPGIGGRGGGEVVTLKNFLPSNGAAEAAEGSREQEEGRKAIPARLRPQSIKRGRK
ncbi:hypothetical protein TWF192_003232 [Orbilia oligospora]|uniref:Uncharacterized protein n=1 Tax=Orbilia oligospora TaxID=2813651 RepID=A0A6G1MDE8_ORBOL|nr:hypothetical protein TWF679_006864 [Orbilia oligospora]KAF3254471.1 hypothetical protein TWF192_003232 [Orbilia oligospora]